MKGSLVSLHPFPEVAVPHGMTLQVSVARLGSELALQYLLQGDLHEVVWPRPSPVPGRRDRLWEETCFEFFVAQARDPRYWEFNLSPSGDWNVYRFDDYRRGMREEDAIDSLPFSCRKGENGFQLAVSFALERIFSIPVSLQIGVSAVIQESCRRVSHWALHHGDSRADFHRRDNFLIFVP